MRRVSKTETYVFGASNRESHDSSGFYTRSLYAGQLPAISIEGFGGAPAARVSVRARSPERWANRIYCQSAEAMTRVPDGSVALAFTSPPYNAGKMFDADLSLHEYLTLIRNVAAEVYRTLVPGGRFVINIANLGRKPYVPMTAYYYSVLMSLGFLPAGEIIWRKGKGMNGSCAWGSWCSAKAPRLRDVHEMLLVFCKERYDRPEKGLSAITPAEFMAATLSVWDIQPESARRVGHPAPFPLELAQRVVKLYSFDGDVVLDPFNGSGTTCVAAALNGRRYVGYEIVPDYVQLAEQRLKETIYLKRQTAGDGR
jgi:modification methylase